MSEKRKADEFVEEINVRSGEALNVIRDLVKKGNVRRITVKTATGREIATVPVTAAVVGAGAALVLGGWWAVVAAAVAYVADVKLEVVRTVDGELEEAVDSAKRKSRVKID